MGLNRMEASPQPPMLMPQLRIRVKILSRVVTSRHVIAQNVPRPRALCTNAGYFSSNACKPAKSVRPAICVFLSKLSRRMMRNVTSNSASFDGSPSQVHLFGKRHQVRRFGQLPVLVGPHLTSATASGLHFIDNERRTGLFSQLLQVGEEFLGRKIVSTFGLRRRHLCPSDWTFQSTAAPRPSIVDLHFCCNQYAGRADICNVETAPLASRVLACRLCVSLWNGCKKGRPWFDREKSRES
ncbi:hypothetical protein T4D_3974 [Trichinella pseudospiralis]|uniref:Uncharacterized protein n=1 Tax=Trichinella pseudospiralis TaxID=6337 RepID=A0A0V1FVW8_TRIPS|nr:hypothetical protein T4D_3974 [Trichinella pseudospiralis]